MTQSPPLPEDLNTPQSEPNEALRALREAAAAVAGEEADA